MIDLRTGKHIEVRVEDENTEGVETAGAAGVLVATGGGLTAHFVDGHKETLSSDASAAHPVVAGGGRRAQGRCGRALAQGSSGHGVP